jgi:ABC-type spermidine/putrescine transport system permease subunit I
MAVIASPAQEAEGTAEPVVAAPRPTPAARLAWRPDPWSLLTVPGLVLIVGCFGSALWFVIHRSFTDPSASTYSTVASEFYVDAFVSTFRAAAMVTMVVLLLGYAYAYAMRVGPPALRALLIVILVAEFSTSWLARAYSWQQILQTNGVVNDVLRGLGIIEEPLTLMRNDLGMVIGTSYVLLPFMVLTLYANMKQVDLATMVAAQSLGARRYQAFWRVFVPSTTTGIVAGAGLIFVMTLGFYITPALLGDPSRLMISALVVRRASQYGDFGVASALSVVLLVATLLGLLITSAVAKRVTRRSREVA